MGLVAARTPTTREGGRACLLSASFNRQRVKEETRELNPTSSSGFLAVGGVAAVLASSCCLGPLILVMLPSPPHSGPARSPPASGAGRADGQPQLHLPLRAPSAPKQFSKGGNNRLEVLPPKVCPLVVMHSLVDGPLLNAGGGVRSRKRIFTLCSCVFFFIVSPRLRSLRSRSTKLLHSV